MTTAAPVVDIRALAAKAARDALARNGGFLDHDRLEDLVSYLSVVGVRYSQRYDPAYGQAETTYLYRVMRMRVTDWYRQELGDSRYPSRQVETVSLDEGMDEDEAGWEDTELKGITNVRMKRWEAAAERAGLDRGAWVVSVLDQAAERTLAA